MVQVYVKQGRKLVLKGTIEKKDEPEAHLAARPVYMKGRTEMQLRMPSQGSCCKHGRRPGSGY